MKGKRLVALALALALLAAGPAALAADAAQQFPAVNAFAGYPDVTEDDWFYDNARMCYEIGLVMGSDVGFEPNRTLTVAECATVAARMREALTGAAIPAPVPNPNLPWYQHYVDYLKDAMAQTGLSFSRETAILSDGAASISRLEFLLLLNVALYGQEVLSPINSISALPDTDDSTVLAFYNAGILTGIDDSGTFAGERTLTRAECAAMVARIARPALRKTFTPAAANASASQGGTGSSAAGGQGLSPSDFARLWLGDDADKTYVTAGGIRVTAADYLAYALTASQSLLLSAQTQGIEFAWDLGVGNTGLTCYEYADGSAVYSALRAAWQASAALDEEAFNAWIGSNQVWKARHILVEDQATADMLYDVLQKDPSQFTPLLAVYGTDPGMQSDPDGYVFGPGEMVAPFEEAVKATPIGGISAPVESSFGWHIIWRLPLTTNDYLSNGFNAFFASVDENDAYQFNTADFPAGIDFPAAIIQWLAQG